MLFQVQLLAENNTDFARFELQGDFFCPRNLFLVTCSLWIKYEGEIFRGYSECIMQLQYADHIVGLWSFSLMLVIHSRRSKTWCIMKRTVNMSAGRATKGDLSGEHRILDGISKIIPIDANFW